MRSSMRCPDAERELAVPSADRDSAALADHLAGCPTCALWADQVEQLDLLWDATRPALPSDARWQGLWNSVNDRLAASVASPIETAAHLDLVAMPVVHKVPAPALPLSRAWKRRGIVAFSLAQAAALLLAFGALMTQQPSSAVASTPHVEIDAGQIVVIRDDGEVVRQAAIDPDAAPNAFDDTFAMFNALEAMAE